MDHLKRSLLVPMYLQYVIYLVNLLLFNKRLGPDTVL